MLALAVRRSKMNRSPLAAVILLAGCGTAASSSTSTIEQHCTVAGGPLGGAIGAISAEDFQAALDNFSQVEEITDGLGPIFNGRACGNCHTEGTIGGAGVQIERRFGRVVDGVFDPLTEKGGSLRQLFALDSFTGADGQSCDVPLEQEPEEATVHDVGRLTTPLFGLGLVDVMPDDFFLYLASIESPDVAGIPNWVQILLPNPEDPNQYVGSWRVGRFGWKAGVPTLAQFAADAYVNEMGITTQHCSNGVSVLDFATESAPNGIPQPPGCDDLAPPAPEGIPEGTDDSVGDCDGGRNELQADVENFRRFMTHLDAPPQGDVTYQTLAGGDLFSQIGCAECHRTETFYTPWDAPSGLGNIAFRPFSDFLVHDMGSLGDGIGNAGDSVDATRLMRTAPLWGIRFRSHFLHDGRATDIPSAIWEHDGQGAAARDAFNALSADDQDAVTAYVLSLGT